MISLVIKNINKAKKDKKKKKKKKKKNKKKKKQTVSIEPYSISQINTYWIVTCLDPN